MRKTIAALGTLAVCVLAGCSGSSEGGTASDAPVTSSASAPETFSITGEVRLPLTKSKDAAPGQACAGTGVYLDIADGTQVSVKDGKGATLALGELRASGYIAARCVLEVFVADVPAGSDFYRVQVGRQPVTEYTEQQVRSPLALNLA